MKLTIEGNVRHYDDKQILALIKTHASNAKTGQTRQSLMALWWNRLVERRQMKKDLRSFTDAVLQDFGMTRQDAEKEVNKPFWRA